MSSSSSTRRPPSAGCRAPARSNGSRRTSRTSAAGIPAPWGGSTPRATATWPWPCARACSRGAWPSSTGAPASSIVRRRRPSSPRHAGSSPRCSARWASRTDSRRRGAMSAALVGEWSRLLAASLVEAGIVHAVVCPGSRSTPFAWALAERPELVCHSLIDERDGAFFALGIARVTGEPALVLSTSGSAAANFFPAIVEARLARLPLLVVTADRPLELQAAEAAQTIDQVKLYGDHVRAFFDLGTPEAAPSALAGLKRSVLQAVLATRGPECGAVHLNARARKPLEPAPPTPHDRALVAAVDALVQRGPTRVSRAALTADPLAIAELGRELARAERALVVCGPLPVFREQTGALVRGLAARLGAPVFAEATSGAR